MTETTGKQSSSSRTEQTYWIRTQKSGNTITYDRPPEVKTWYNSTDGVKNPRWRVQIALGQNATTPFEGFEYQIKRDKPYNLTATHLLQSGAPSYAPATDHSNGNFRPTYGPTVVSDVSGVPLAKANRDALGALVENIRSKHAAFTGSTTAAEFAQTIRLLRNPASALRDGVAAYLRNVKRNGRKWRKSGRKAATEALAGTWLEYAFGWTPLISEISSIKNVIESQYKQGLHERVWAYGFGEDYGLLSKQTDTSMFYSQPYPVVKRRKRYFARVKYTANLGYNTASPNVITNLGFAPREWLPALWEVVPWSFLVDYFTNIGDIVSAVSYTNSGVEFVNKQTTQVMIEDFPIMSISEGIDYPWADGIVTTGASGACELHAKKVVRGEYNGLLVPSLGFQMPGFGRRWLNLTALGLLRKDALRALR